MEKIYPKGLSLEYIQNTYKDGYYIEAIQLLHGFIENKLQEV